MLGIDANTYARLGWWSAWDTCLVEYGIEAVDTDWFESYDDGITSIPSGRGDRIRHLLRKRKPKSAGCAEYAQG